jgi:hypothetical protein
MEPINPRDDEVRATCNATNVESSIPTNKATNVVKYSTDMPPKRATVRLLT